MLVLRKQNLEVNHFMIGDQIPVGKYTATCQKVTDGKAIFLLDQYLDKTYQMSHENTNKGGYKKSDLRATLKTANIDDNFINIKEQIIPFENGDLLRIATVGEMFETVNDYYESDYDKQWELMKDRKNRIAIHDNKPYEWGWLQNTVKGSSTYFAAVGSRGGVDCYAASSSGGVRPAFQVPQANNVSCKSYHEKKNDLTCISKEYLINRIDRVRSQLLNTSVELSKMCCILIEVKNNIKK